MIDVDEWVVIGDLDRAPQGAILVPGVAFSMHCNAGQSYEYIISGVNLC